MVRIFFTTTNITPPPTKNQSIFKKHCCFLNFLIILHKKWLFGISLSCRRRTYIKEKSVIFYSAGLINLKCKIPLGYSVCSNVSS